MGLAVLLGTQSPSPEGRAEGISLLRRRLRSETPENSPVSERQHPRRARSGSHSGRRREFTERRPAERRRESTEKRSVVEAASKRPPKRAPSPSGSSSSGSRSPIRKRPSLLKRSGGGFDSFAGVPEAARPEIEKFSAFSTPVQLTGAAMARMKPSGLGGIMAQRWEDGGIIADSEKPPVCQPFLAGRCNSSACGSRHPVDQEEYTHWIAYFK